MFYFPNVLQRHTGCFSTVWLAATKGTRIVKREYLKVNVMNTCRKIMQYILQQVPPPYHGCPIPRLSLYLSAQLSYGVVCVYHRQCDILIEEMKVTLERLYKAEKQLKIDFLQPDQQLLLPDSLMLMQMLEDAPDPFFGMMDIPPELPDPYMIPQIRTLLETSGPELVRYERTPPRHRRTRRKEESDHLASPEAITMREEEPTLLPPVEIGQDLPELSALDLELLASDLPAFPEAETLPDHRKRGKQEPKDNGLPETEKPKKPRKEREVQKDDRETSLGMEREMQLQLERERYEAEIEKRRRELQEMERSIKLLREEQRQMERQRESERQQEREIRKEIEREVLQEMEKEMEHLREAREELDYLQITGAGEELLLEQRKEIQRLKELVKERASQWEAEKLLQLQLEREKDRERLKERERKRKQIKEAEQEMEALKTTLMEIEEERRTEGEHVDETRRSVTEVKGSPIPGVPSEMVSELDAPMQLEEAPVEPIAMPSEGAPEMPSPQQVSPQLIVPELADRPTRQTVRGSRLIIDKNTQIQSKIMQKQTSDPHIFTQQVGPVILPHMKPRTAASLIESPTYEHFMAPELTALWSRCAVLEPLQYVREREEESFSELEMMRAVADSGVSIMLSSEVSLEVSEADHSRPIIFTPEEGRVPSVQEDKLLPIVSEMPELIVEMPETEEILLEDVERKLYSQIDSDGQSEFLGLTPHSLSRLMVSRFFSSCLVLCTQKVIRMEQTEPYGRIRITPGRQYKQD
ncbi:meiotic recombination protein REC8 homolog [Lithobates pipiens]